MDWLKTIPRVDQFTSAVVIGELYSGAFRSADSARHRANIEKHVLPAVSVLPYDLATARVYGDIRAQLERAGTRLADADLQIAATALQHELELVTGHLRHFQRVLHLRVERVLAETKAPRS